MKLPHIISENTGVSVGLVIALVGGVFWLSTMWAQGRANASAIEAISLDRKEKREEYLDTMNQISEEMKKMNTSISRMEGAVCSRFKCAN